MKSWNEKKIVFKKNLFQFQTEIVKRMSAIIGQVLPFLSQEHQQQVATAVERAKQVTMADLNTAIGGGAAGAAGAVAAAAGVSSTGRDTWRLIPFPLLQQRPDIARLMQLHAQAQAGQQAANLANLVNGPPGMPGLPPGALGLPPGLQGLPHGLNIPTSLSSSLLQGLPTSIAASLGGLGGPNPLHPALSMLKPQLPLDPKREDEIRKSLSESNGKFEIN